ncbi:MAG: hypothetical protein AB7V27_10435 [Candidatus Binatia bacterium]
MKSNASSVADRTATWKMTLTKILGDPEIPCEVAYKTPAAPASATRP